MLPFMVGIVLFCLLYLFACFDCSKATPSNTTMTIMSSPGAISSYRAGGNYAMMTFDDGPNAVYTPQILDILARKKVHATFFLIGKEISKNIEILHRIHREGHEVTISYILSSINLLTIF